MKQFSGIIGPAHVNVSAALVNPFINPIFDLNSIYGWTETVTATSSVVVSGRTPNTYPAGGPLQGTDPYLPTDGNTNFLLIPTGSAASLVYQMVSQEAIIPTGMILFGYAALEWNDIPPRYDRARVRIVQSGATIATPYYKAGVNPENYTNYPWTYWEWTCPANGTYTLVFESANANSSTVSSMGLFSGVMIK